MCKCHQSRRQFLQHRLHGLHGRLLRQPVLPRAQLARRHGAGHRRIGLPRAGLRLSAGRQRRPRHRDRHRHRFLCRLHRRRARARPASPIPWANLLPITLKTPQTGRTFALNPVSHRRAEPLQRRPRRHRCQHRHAGRARHQRRRSMPTPSSCPTRSSRTSIRPPHGRPSPPTSAAASTWAGAAPSPTPSKP